MTSENTHSHKHHHHPRPGEGADRRLWITLGLNVGITLAEFIGGILSNSLALISDAVHNLSDSSSLGVSLFARKVSERSPDRRRTFGYRRAEIIGAFVNLVVLVIVAVFLIREGIERLLAPEGIDGLLMFWVALGGLVGNVLSVIILHADSKRSLNIRSSYIHLFWDSVSSVAVIISGLLMWRYEIYIVDPIVTILVAVYILWTTWGLLGETIGILMESSAPDTDIPEIERALETVESVIDVHHVHVWRLDEHETLLECHAQINSDAADSLERIKSELKTILNDRFGIHHSTIEFELTPCGDEGLGCA
ncbi:MAG: cation diffusion facilitator family transporter [Spirochaetales bacterium]